MNDDIKKDRSPNYPKATLADAIESVKKLHSKAGKAQIKAEVAAGALGYSGMNGAALTALGILNQYGLIERHKGGVTVSPLAVKLIHPLNLDQLKDSKREAALNPRVFKDIYTDGLGDCSEDVLCNHLIQNSFTPEGARKAAFVYKQNVEFANLSEGGIVIDGSEGENPSEEDRSIKPIMSTSSLSPNPTRPALTNTPLLKNPTLEALAALSPSSKMLARYSIPLGSNEATIIFTGEILSSEDFDALGEYVKLFKKQFERTTVTTTTPSSKTTIESPVK